MFSHSEGHTPAASLLQIKKHALTSVPRNPPPHLSQVSSLLAPAGNRYSGFYTLIFCLFLIGNFIFVHGMVHHAVRFFVCGWFSRL